MSESRNLLQSWCLMRDVLEYAQARFNIQKSLGTVRWFFRCDPEALGALPSQRFSKLALTFTTITPAENYILLAIPT